MKYDLAPIVLFAYNRPWHTRLVLDSLAKNAESQNSILYIYCDGAKEGADTEMCERIGETRKIAKNENRFKKVIVTEQTSNKGLSNSIISGVTEVVNKHGIVIVLEDDLILSPYFLFYMNDSLERYENNLKIGQIGACNFFACGSKYPTTFFIPVADCWGWATWKNRWSYFNKDARHLQHLLQQKKLLHKFNVYGSYAMDKMLQMQISGQVNSWVIRWQAVCTLNDWLILYPNPSLSNHVESKGGTHTNANVTPPLCTSKPNLETIDEVEMSSVIKAMKRGYSGKGDYYGKFKKEFYFVSLIKSFNAMRKNIQNFVPPILIKLLKPKSKYGFFGNYKTWEEAMKDAKGYDSPEILEKVKNSSLKVKNGEAIYERGSVVFDKIQYSWPLLASLLWIASQNNNELNIIDFGGSLGSSYHQNKEFLSHIKNLRWNIVEQTRFIDYGKRFFEDDKLSFFCNINESLSKSKSETFLALGVIQYLENPYAFIQEIINHGFKYIIFDRTMFLKNLETDRITVQKVTPQIYDASFPAWFLNEKKFLNMFTKKYTLIAEFKSLAGEVELDDNTKAIEKGFILKINDNIKKQ